MDMMEAKGRFSRAMGHCDAIVQIHEQHGGGGKGQRQLEPSLNRAIVVLAVAAWQTAVQDLCLAALDYSQPKGGTGLGPLLRGHVVQAVAGFSTPASDQTRELLRLVDFDPYPYWTWGQAGGRGVGPITISSSEAAIRTNDWLKLRHGIAHGHPSLSVVDVLQSVRGKSTAWLKSHPNAKPKDAINHLKHIEFEPSLRLVDAKRCVGHFRRMANLTAEGLAAEACVPSSW